MSSYSLKLVDGTFSAEEASGFLVDMIDRKISYNRVECFRANYNPEIDVAQHKKRIAELEDIRAELREIIQKAEKENVRLKVNGIVDIQEIR